jgi:hypothetical protein
VEDNLTVQCECATAPALVFTGSNPTFLVRHAASIVNNGAFALCNIAAGGLLQVMLAEASLILQSAAGVLFHLGAGSFLTTLIFDSASALSSSMNGSGVITGPVGSQWFDVRAPAGSPIDASTFLGTRHISYSAPATMLQYFTTNQATSVPSVSAITMQQAHMMGMTWVENVGANYTIDTGSGPPGSIDGAIRLTSEGKTITLPLAATFPGREITIIDASGGVAGFVMQPNVADSIGTAGAGVPVTNIPGQSLALTIKSMAPAAPTEWRIISSTLLS